MTKHTPEPWRLVWDSATLSLTIADADNRCIIQGQTPPFNFERPAYEHIVACVNACAGLNPEAVAHLVAVARGVVCHLPLDSQLDNAQVSGLRYDLTALDTALAALEGAKE